MLLFIYSNLTKTRLELALHLGPQLPQEIFPRDPGSAQALQELIATQSEVVVQYPAKPRTALHEAQPPFAAKGVALQDTESRQRGIEVFENSARLDGRTELIVTGMQDGRPQTLILERHMTRDGESPYTSVRSFTFAGSEKSNDSQSFTAEGTTLSPDGQTLQFARDRVESGDMTSFVVGDMYLVPTVRSEHNPDQVRGAQLGRLFPRLSSGLRRQIFLQ